MIASLAHTLERTVAAYDQLAWLWGKDARPNLTVHGLTHDQVHQAGGSQVVYRVADVLEDLRIVVTRVATPLGYEVALFGAADVETCETCRRLARQDDSALELLQRAGIPDRLEGGGM